MIGPLIYQVIIKELFFLNPPPLPRAFPLSFPPSFSVDSWCRQKRQLGFYTGPPDEDEDEADPAGDDGDDDSGQPDTARIARQVGTYLHLQHVLTASLSLSLFRDSSFGDSFQCCCCLRIKKHPGLSTQGARFYFVRYKYVCSPTPPCSASNAAARCDLLEE